MFGPNRTVGWTCILVLIIPIVSANIFNIGKPKTSKDKVYKFPKNFDFGAATSAYQIEGAWNVDGKGASIWDNYTHTNPSPIANGDTGDIACNSYYKYKEDVALAASLGLRLYRFSFAWTRILPNGYNTEINEKGIEYYKNLTSEIIKHNMIPLATIYHWDLPQKLIDDGIGWTNPKIVEVITNYSRVVIDRFPEVGVWVTINEPKQICHSGYGLGNMAPGIASSGIEEYQCSYFVLKAHAAMYHMYKEEFSHYKAKMSIVIDCAWIEPQTNSTIDIEAANRQIQFECGLYFHPVFARDWPPLVKSIIYNRSIEANLPKSRLPDLTAEEVEYISGTHDYLGLNHYYSILAADAIDAPFNVTSYEADLGVDNSFDPSWVKENNGFFTIVPYGVRRILNWLKDQYGDLEIIITELGMTEDGTSLNDTIRIDFFKDYFCNILAAVYEDKVRVTGVTAWSLLDNFEWSLGYTSHFGFYYIDFANDPQRTRVPKLSVEFFKELTRTRKLTCGTSSRKWSGPCAWKNGKPYKGKAVVETHDESHVMPSTSKDTNHAVPTRSMDVVTTLIE